MCYRISSFVFVISALYPNENDGDMDEITSFYENSRLFSETSSCHFVK